MSDGLTTVSGSRSTVRGIGAGGTRRSHRAESPDGAHSYGSYKALGLMGLSYNETAVPLQLATVDADDDPAGANEADAE